MPEDAWCTDTLLSAHPPGRGHTWRSQHVPPNTCTDDQHVGTAQVIVTQGDALCHHLCPPLYLKSLCHQRQKEKSLSFLSFNLGSQAGVRSFPNRANVWAQDRAQMTSVLTVPHSDRADKAKRLVEEACFHGQIKLKVA